MNKKWFLQATLEFLINIFIIMMPFFISFINYKFYSGAVVLDYKEILTKSFSIMAISIFSATILAPVFYSVIKDPPVKFKSVFFLGSFIIYTAGLILHLFETFSSSTNETLQLLGWLVFLLAIFIYILYVYTNSFSYYSESAPAILDSNVNDNLDNYRSHRSQ